MTRKRSRTIKRRDPISHNYKFTRLCRCVIYRALEARLPITRAVELAGIDHVTYRQWMKRGLRPDQPVYTQFRRKVKALQAQHEREALQIIQKVARGGYDVVETQVKRSDKTGMEVSRKTTKKAPTWQAAAWYLERRYKEEYGRDLIDPLQNKTPAEVAHEIKVAADELFNSIPTEED